MSILAQGTQVFMVRSATVKRIKGATAFNPAGNPRDQLDDTTLEDTDSRQYKKGLGTPGQASLTLNADPSDAVHIELHEMANDGSEERVDFYVGWSDGPVDADGKPTAFPEISSGSVTLPETRTWYHIRGYVSDFPLDFASNALVSTQATIQRSGKGTWTPKAPAAGTGE
ncbi:phage tail tube protein [Salinicola lusitanus]|uniref:Phage tail tube protein n=1 Tax=Salinicola lusitanus TaxID=1949085 RepID=A0ABZ3CQJ8_9GAMM